METVETDVAINPLTNILGETTPETPQAEAEPEPDKTTKAEETGAKPEVEPDPEPSPDSETVPIAVMHGERDRRQTAEGRVKELEAQLTREEPERVSVLEDEDAAFAAADKRAADTLSSKLFAEGEAIAVELHDQETVDQAYDWANSAIKTNPFLAEQLTGVSEIRQHREVVKLHKSFLAQAELENPETLRDKIKAEVKAEMEAEAAGKKKVTDSIPKSLVGESSKGGLKGSDYKGPAKLNSLIGEGG